MQKMSVSQALIRRYSCRAYLDKPVSSMLLQDILENARRAPSGSNLQPCKLHVINSASKRALLKSKIEEKFPNTPRGDGFDFRIYPEKINDELRRRRSDCGETLYRALGIPREDKIGRYQQALKNSEFFGAPVAIIMTVDPCIADAQLVDCGILLQSIMLLAEEADLSSCPQAFWTMWPNTIREVLGLENELVVVGLAIGYADTEAVVNSVRQPRIDMDDFVVTHN